MVFGDEIVFMNFWSTECEEIRGDEYKISVAAVFQCYCIFQISIIKNYKLNVLCRPGPLSEDSIELWYVV